MIPIHPACLYFDQSHIKTSNHIDYNFELKQIKRKCKELELENSQLKEQISILEVQFWLISENETEKNQKNHQKKKRGRVR
jgi:DNA helicase IV